MAIELRFENGGSVQLQPSQLKNHLYYADAGIEGRTHVVTSIEKVGFDEEFITLYRWRMTKDNGSGSGSRLRDVIEDEVIASDALYDKVLEHVKAGDFPFTEDQMKFTREGAKQFLTEAREEYDGDSDFGWQIAESPDPDSPETHKITFELCYSAH